MHPRDAMPLRCLMLCVVLHTVAQPFIGSSVCQQGHMMLRSWTFINRVTQSSVSLTILPHRVDVGAELWRTKERAREYRVWIQLWLLRL